MANQVIKFGQFLAEAKARQTAPPKLLDMNPMEEGEPGYKPEWVYQLPAVLPAAVPVELARLGKEYGTVDQVPDYEGLNLAIALFPPDVLTALTNVHHLDVEELGQLFEQVFGLYAEEIGMATEPSATEKNQGSPQAAGLTSSTPGHSSRPISKESTGSTLPPTGTAGMAAYPPSPGENSESSLTAWGRNPSWYSPSPPRTDQINTAIAAARK